MRPGKRFGAWLRKQLDRQGMMNRDLADRCGVDASMVSNWLRGIYHDSHPSNAGDDFLPSRKHTLAIARALREPEDLVLLLAGHAPTMDPIRVYEAIHPGALNAWQRDAKAAAL